MIMEIDSPPGREPMLGGQRKEKVAKRKAKPAGPTSPWPSNLTIHVEYHDRTPAEVPGANPIARRHNRRLGRNPVEARLVIRGPDRSSLYGWPLGFADSRASAERIWPVGRVREEMQQEWESLVQRFRGRVRYSDFVIAARVPEVLDAPCSELLHSAPCIDTWLMAKESVEAWPN